MLKLNIPIMQEDQIKAINPASPNRLDEKFQQLREQTRDPKLLGLIEEKYLQYCLFQLDYHVCGDQDVKTILDRMRN